jgi:hypothetical protein
MLPILTTSECVLLLSRQMKLLDEHLRLSFLPLGLSQFGSQQFYRAEELAGLLDSGSKTLMSCLAVGLEAGDVTSDFSVTLLNPCEVVQELTVECERVAVQCCL